MTFTQHAIVMAFGALITGAGLILLFLRKEQAENRIKLFNQEFQISTPALIVFLAGCGVFVMPLVMPIKNDPVMSIGLPWQSNGPPADTNNVIAVTTDEKEPNDQITAANSITFGTTIRGSIATDQDRDFFKFKTPGRGLTTPGQVPNKVRIILRKTSLRGFWAAVTVYDNVENKVIDEDASGDNPISLVFEGAPDSFFYVMVKPVSTHGDYEIVVKGE